MEISEHRQDRVARAVCKSSSKLLHISGEKTTDTTLYAWCGYPDQFAALKEAKPFARQFRLVPRRDTDRETRVNVA